MKNPLNLLLPGLLALSACGAPTNPVITTPVSGTPTHAASVYELRLQRTSDGTLSGSVVRPLVVREVTDPLTFTYVSSAVVTNVGPNRFVRITYNVTNNSAQPLDTLSLVPVDTDTDPATATAGTPTPTTGSTFFKNVKDFGGNDASARATDITPEQARDLSGAADPAATPYVAVNSSGVTPGMPAGLLLGAGGKSPKGWQLAGTLAPGATAPITFATSYPILGASDPYTFSVVFMAVSDVTVPLAVTPAPGANPNVTLPLTGPAYVNGTIGDPTDVASGAGLKFTVAASDADAASLVVTATSSNAAVATTSVSGTGANRTVKINPLTVGKADINVTVADGARTASYTVKYAASQAPGATASTRYFSNVSNASSAQDMGGDTMLVADDEFNELRLYPRSTSSVPLAQFDFNAQLALPDAANPEVDLEASARSGNRIYWLGSHSNSANAGNARPNRYRLFATDVSGSGAATTLSYVGRYDSLRSDLINWDSSNGHGLGAGALGLSASASTGTIPESAGLNGFNIEGLAFRPGTTTAYLGFRAPIEPTTNRTRALIVPVTNFTGLVGGNPATGPATFGAPIQLDLGGRGIRELKCNDTSCLILAGPATSGSNFALYSWSGNPTDAPHLRNDLSALATSMEGSLESIVSVPGGDLDSAALTGTALQFLSDNGDSVYYGDGTIAKDLVTPAQNWQKFRSETVTLGALPATTCTVNAVTVTPASPTLTVGGTQTFTAAFTTTPANCTTTTTWSSSDTSRLTIDPTTGAAQAVAAGSATVTATVTPGSGSAVTGTTTATINAPVATLPNVTVYRVGDGSAALGSTGTAVFLDTFKGTDGSLVGTVALPTTTIGSNRGLVASGTATSEGLLTRSTNGKYLVLTGYNAALGTSGLSGTTSATVNRVIGRVDAAGVIDTTTALTDAASGNNVRSAASVDGSAFWVAGGTGGVRYATLGATTSTPLNSASPTNVRQLNFFGGQLYASTGSGTTGIYTVGTGTPTTAGQTPAILPGLSGSTGPYSFFFADLDGTPGVDTLYVADATNSTTLGLQKFSLSGGTWSSKGSVSGVGLFGLTGTVNGSQVTLFATTGTTLYSITDSSGYGGTLSGSLTSLKTAATNTAFRGVALAPTP